MTVPPRADFEDKQFAQLTLFRQNSTVIAEPDLRRVYDDNEEGANGT